MGDFATGHDEESSASRAPRAAPATIDTDTISEKIA
jgi:hypothetical protein